MIGFGRLRRVRLWLRQVRRRLRTGWHGIVAALHTHGGICLTARPGWRVRLHPDAYEDLRYWLSYEAATLAALANVWRPGSCIIDVGAHHGAFSICCLRGGGHGIRLLAVEPSPAAWPLLAANLEVHTGERWTLHRAALGQECGTRILYTSFAHMLVGDPSVHAGFPADTVQVPMVTLDVLCRDEGVKPDIVKIDVEGFEDHVINGASATLAARPVILLEWHRSMLERRNTDPMVCIRRLEEAGYQFELSANIRDGHRHLMSAHELPSGDILHLLCQPSLREVA